MVDNKNLPVVQNKKQGFFARFFYNLFHKKNKSVEQMMDENQKQINETMNPKSALEGQTTVVVPGEKILSQESPVDINTMEVIKVQRTKQEKVDDELGFLRFSQEIIDLQHGLQEGRINPDSLSDEKIKELNGVYAVQIKELNRHIDDYKQYLGVPNVLEKFVKPVTQNNMEPAMAAAGGYGNVNLNPQDNIREQQVSSEQPVSHAKRLKISNLAISDDNSQTLASSQPQFNHESEEQKVEIELNDKQPNNGANPIQSENVEIKPDDIK